MKAHITSLKSSIDIEDVTEYFRNVCNVVGDGEIELSNAHLLGKGKADIVLKGLSESGNCYCQEYYTYTCVLFM